MINDIKNNLTSAIFVIIILVIFSALVLTPMLSMIILGAIFAYAIRPLSNRMEPYLKYKSIAIFVGMIIVIIPLIAIIILFINTIIASTPAFVEFVKTLNLGSINSTNIQNYLPIQQYIPAESTSPVVTSVINSIYLGVEDILRGLTEYLLGLLKSIPTVLLQLFIFFASTFYFARDGDRVWDYLDYMVPEDRKHYFKTLIKETDRVLKSIFFGHFVTATITGVVAGIGFALLGYPYALFLGTLTGFFQLMPIVGHWPTLVGLAIYDAIIGNYFRAVEVMLLGVLLSLMDMYIRPKLAGKYADIHPLIFLLGFLCGPLVLGLVGFIIGPLILGVTYAAVVAYKKENQDKPVEKIVETNVGSKIKEKDH
ncbi:AI-2E family transporter [Methanobacterium sp. SMA-27]|uniref:AI-2E family transporter n=1 Tax=Methanobacterium sp. SMA-27 TaxID=1495336 RepID=UPI00064E8A99|nr:AI-2E family transporter [Methanobacterium sp. SMA-27]